MRFVLHILPEALAALLSVFVEWFLFHDLPVLYDGALPPLAVAWVYTALLLAVWLLPVFWDSCRHRGGVICTALNLLPAEIIFGIEFVYRLPFAGVAVLILLGAAVWLVWYECYRRNTEAWDEGKRGAGYRIICRRNRHIAVRLVVVIASVLLLIPGLYGFHVARTETAETTTAVYETNYEEYEADPSFLVDLKHAGIIGTI